MFKAALDEDMANPKKKAVEKEQKKEEAPKDCSDLPKDTTKDTKASESKVTRVVHEFEPTEKAVVASDDAKKPEEASKQKEVESWDFTLKIYENSNL